MPTKEKLIETAIMQFVRYSGGWCQKINSGSMMAGYTRKGRGGGATGFRQYKVKLADAGTPDLICCIRGKFVSIEVKKDNEEIEKWRKTAETDLRSSRQHAQQDLIRQAGGFTLIACSVEQVEQGLKKLNLI